MDTSAKETEVNNHNVLESISATEDVTRETENPQEVLTRVELDVASSSEKSSNLYMLMMRVATRESEYDAFNSSEEVMLKDPTVLELDLLCGILDSEVNELEHLMSKLRTEMDSVSKYMLLRDNLGIGFEVEKKMLQDSEESLRQSLEKVSEIKEQSSDIQRNLLISAGDDTQKYRKDTELLEDVNISDRISKIKMETPEQKREVLKMLDESIARELQLEKSIDESKEVEEDLKLRLQFSEHENLCLEEEDLVLLKSLFDGENTAEVLMGISKDLLGKIHTLIFSQNAAINRENKLKSKLEDSIHELKAKDASLQRTESSNTKFNEVLVAETNTLKAGLKETEKKLVLVDAEAFTLREKVSSLEAQMKDYEQQLMNVNASGDENQGLLQKLDEMSSTQNDLRERISKAESRADRAEGKCTMLTESNIELNEELNLLKASGNTTEMVGSLERKMRESDIVLQHAVASAEASQENQSMLSSTIKDMEDVIEKLKVQVSKAENLAESAEDKCIVLSECNSDLKEELCCLNGKVDCLKASLRQADELKKATAKDIRNRTKGITNLVMQLAFERERLQKQISLLLKKNNILMNQFQQTSKGQANMRHTVKEDKDDLTSMGTMRNSNAANMDQKDENEVGLADSKSDSEAVRDIDARQLNIKYVIMTVLVVVISVFAASLYQPPDSRL